jgi:PAS domain S-box-containing protein
MTTAGTRVFIVEDEALIAMELADRLAHLGYVVCGTAARGETALESVPAARPDVVLMDVNLAGALSGVETAERLKPLLDVPIVFLTAYSDEPLLRGAMETSPAGFLLKPFEAREVHATIQTALRQHRLEQALRNANERLAASERFAQGVLDALGSHLAVLDASGRIVSTNAAWRRFAESAGEQLLQLGEGANYLEVCDATRGSAEADATRVAEGIRAVLRRTVPSFAHKYPMEVGGAQRWFLVRVSLLAGTETPLAVLTHDDVTLVHEALERAVAGERVFASLALASPVGVYRTDVCGEYQSVNRRWSDLTGLGERDAVGTHAAATVHPDDRKRIVGAREAAIRRGVVFAEEYRFLHLDGSVIWVLDQAVPIAGCGKTKRFQWIVPDSRR